MGWRLRFAFGEHNILSLMVTICTCESSSPGGATRRARGRGAAARGRRGQSRERERGPRDRETGEPGPREHTIRDIVHVGRAPRSHLVISLLVIVHWKRNFGLRLASTCARVVASAGSAGAAAQPAAHRARAMLDASRPQ